MDLKDLFKSIKELENKEVKVEGWIRKHRDQKTFGFIDFSDGTCNEHLQIVYDETIGNFIEIQKLLVGCAIEVKGIIVKSSGNQEYEMKATEIKVLGNCPEDYPIQPKRHTREFLREQAYLRPRTNLFQAVFRIRSVAASAIHEYFQSHNYVYVHTPLITTTDCEGSDQMFKLTTLDFNNIPLVDGKADMSKDLFGKTSYITKTHANEFWMIEPEIAFCDLKELMNIEEEMLKYVVKTVLDRCSDEIDFCTQFVEKSLKDKLTKLINSEFVRITHHDVVNILKKADVKWEFEPDYMEDIAKEHERYITEYFNGPVFITDWPKDIKAWYMKENSDGKTVAAVDLEVPGAGELMGGSQREEDYDTIIKRAQSMGVDLSVVDWYLNLRKYGGCIHSGFGMGFERLIMYLTGVDNIRDVIPFPRTPGNCEY